MIEIKDNNGEEVRTVPQTNYEINKEAITNILLKGYNIGVDKNNIPFECTGDHKMSSKCRECIFFEHGSGNCPNDREDWYKALPLDEEDDPLKLEGIMNRPVYKELLELFEIARNIEETLCWRTDCNECLYKDCDCCHTAMTAEILIKLDAVIMFNQEDLERAREILKKMREKHND